MFPTYLILILFQARLAKEVYACRLGVIFNALTISFHISAGIIALLAKTGGLPGCRTVLESFLVLYHNNFVGVNNHRALGKLHLAFEDADLFDIVNTELIRFQMHRFVTVSKFSLAGWRMADKPYAKQGGVFNFCRAHIRF